MAVFVLFCFVLAGGIWLDGFLGFETGFALSRELKALETCERVQHCQRVRLPLKVCQESRTDLEPCMLIQL